MDIIADIVFFHHKYFFSEVVLFLHIIIKYNNGAQLHAKKYNNGVIICSNYTIRVMKCLQKGKETKSIALMLNAINFQCFTLIQVWQYQTSMSAIASKLK